MQIYSKFKFKKLRAVIFSIPLNKYLHPSSVMFKLLILKEKKF